MNKIYLQHREINDAACRLGKLILQHQKATFKSEIGLYPVPRGGIPVAYLLLRHIPNSFIVEVPEAADFIVDDIIDSGATLDRYTKNYPDIPFIALYSKNQFDLNDWIVFPWEVSDNQETETVEDNVIRLLQYIGEDVNRGGLKETPKRFVKALGEWTSGYDKDPAEILKVFDDGGDNYDQMILVKDIPFYSHCEHHIAPFFGTVSIAYIPDNGRIVGLSKLARLVECYARRLQVQERLTSQIAQALMDHLNPLGVGVHIKARHMCMESRGICKQGHHTETSALLGIFRTDSSVKEEYLMTVK